MRSSHATTGGAAAETAHQHSPPSETVATPAQAALHPRHHDPSVLSSGLEYQSPSDGLRHLLGLFSHVLWTGAVLGLVTIFRYMFSFVTIRKSAGSPFVSRRNVAIDPDLLEDQGPFEPMESAAFLNDNNSVLLKVSDAERYLREAYRDMGIPDSIAQTWLRYAAIL